MNGFESLNNNQEEDSQSEAERVLGSEPSFEEFRKAEDLRSAIETDEQNERPKYCYHGISQNVMKIGSILENGIVAKNKSAGIESYSANNEGYNGDKCVSVAVNIPISEDGYDAYRTYISNGGISFIIEDDNYIYSRHTSSNSGFENEGFIYGGVAPSEIKGILINDELEHKSISELNMLGESGTIFVGPSALNIIRQLTKDGSDYEQVDECRSLIEQYDTTANDDSLDPFDRMDKEDALKERINRCLGTMVSQHYSKLLGKENPELIDVVQYYNKDDLPILKTSQIPPRPRKKASGTQPRGWRNMDDAFPSPWSIEGWL